MLDKNKAEKSHHHHRHVCCYSKVRRCVCCIGYRTILAFVLKRKARQLTMSALARNVTELHIISKHVTLGLENLLFASESTDYELLGTKRVWPSALVSIQSVENIDLFLIIFEKLE